MLQLSLATSEDQVRRAMEHPQTGAYDVCRRERLRQRYVSVYLSEDEKWLDSHRDFITGGGYTEHTVFFSQLMDPRGYLRPLPAGPQNSQPKKKKVKAKPKRSARTKAMLEPPELESGVLVVDEAPEKRQGFVEDYLPGAAASLHEPPFLHCVAVAADDDDRRCWAPLARGGRCKRLRQRGNYCKQHFLEWSGEDQQKFLLQGWAKNLGDAADALVYSWAVCFLCWRHV